MESFWYFDTRLLNEWSIFIQLEPFVTDRQRSCGKVTLHVSLSTGGWGVVGYPWYQVLSWGRVSLSHGLSGGGVGFLWSMSRLGEYLGVGYSGMVGYGGGRVSRRYTLAPPHLAGVDANSAVGTHSTGMLSCLSSRQLGYSST